LTLRIDGYLVTGIKSIEPYNFIIFYQAVLDHRLFMEKSQGENQALDGEGFEPWGTGLG